MLSVRDVGTVPPELRRPDGLSRYRLRNAADVRHHRPAARPRRRSSRAPAAPARPRWPGRRWSWPGWSCRPPGSSADQQAAVLQILSSGRRGDVLIGPAGAGKSRTVGALARVWETAGRRPGARGGDLADRHPGPHRRRADRAEHHASSCTGSAPTRRAGCATGCGPRTWSCVDEAGMSGTDELDRISALVAAAGAKLLYTGDHDQLAAVGAGGMLELLVRDADADRADRDPPVHPRLGARGVDPAARRRPGRAGRSTTRTAASGAAPSRR